MSYNRLCECCVKGPRAACLADYCDVFRCNIVSGKLRPHFWDIAMCKDDEMQKLNARCQVIQRS